jgi:signal transduction histidine kinase
VPRGRGEVKGSKDAPLRYLGALLLLIVAYAVSGRIGLGLAHEQVNATLVWPPTGLALGALLLCGPRLWPGVLVGALLVNVWIGTAPGPSVAIAVGNTLEALAGYWLLSRVLPFERDFRRPFDVVIFVAAALLASSVSATVGVGSLVVFEVIPTSLVGSTYLTWWLGDAGGAVVVAPILILVAHGTPDWPSLAQRTEAWVVFFFLFLTAVPAFFAPHASHWAALFVSNLTIPVVAWAGLRLGHRGAAIAIGVVACLASLGTSQGLGPFSVAPRPVPLLLLWAYLTSIAATALTLAATSAEREASAQARLDDAERERELQEQVLTLQRLESLGLMAGSVAHDFNNLLAAVVGNCNLLLASLKDPEQREYVESILLASRRAAALCSNLLSYSGRSVPRLSDVCLRDLARPLSKLLIGVWPEDVRLELELADELPAIRGDFAELTQVVMNLTLNAGQASGASLVTIRVAQRHFSASDLAAVVPPTEIEAGEHVFLEVEDDGSGLSQEVRGRLFDPFFTTKVSGRGLGLATALGIVSGHRGALLLESELGRGTKVTVVFPGANAVTEAAEAPPEEPSSGTLQEAPPEEPSSGTLQEAPPADPATPKPAPPTPIEPEVPTSPGPPEEPSSGALQEAPPADPATPEAAPPTPVEPEQEVPTSPPELASESEGTLRILLADDTPPILAVTRLFLEGLGHQVVGAKDGQEALEAFQEEDGAFDLAILDVTMPRLSGLELVPLLRELRPALPVVLMSGYSSADIDPLQLQIEFLSKPFEFDDLLVVVERVAAER